MLNVSFGSSFVHVCSVSCLCAGQLARGRLRLNVETLGFVERDFSEYVRGVFNQGTPSQTLTLYLVVDRASTWLKLRLQQEINKDRWGHYTSQPFGI